MYAYLYPDILPVAEARLHITDLSIQRGYGIFDFFKVDNGHVYFLEDYLDRFTSSAATMRLEVPLKRNEIRDIIFTLIEKNKIVSSGIKIILTGGYSEDGFQPGVPNLIMIQNPLVIPPTEQLLKGISIITHEYIRDVPGVKTINYTTGIWLLDRLRQANAADVLYHRDGLVSEFPRSNFFIVKSDNTVITPATNVLRGVTRKNVLALSSAKFTTQEGNVTLDDVYSAKEAFLTSTTKRIVPVTHVNGRAIGNGRAGDVSKMLLQDLIELENQDFKRR